MRLINIICIDKESFKYSVLLYMYYYNKKESCQSITDNNINPYMDIKFNENSDIVQFERDNSHINLFIIDCKY